MGSNMSCKLGGTCGGRSAAESEQEYNNGNGSFLGGLMNSNGNQQYNQQLANARNQLSQLGYKEGFACSNKFGMSTWLKIIVAILLIILIVMLIYGGGSQEVKLGVQSPPSVPEISPIRPPGFTETVAPATAI